ncbi:2-keto-4-pentenoate hydratase [Ligilactobacillus salitolerans]|uniref:2-keto-4-pentenoate hydratase n=1 Tax=Ligilactobacillus salitolerans TaxID=1808352 RepID=A0A401IWJ4_9LACO|nr:2-keto-4-pentenoate hydratase [Ligilactobacillus salitolerans]GBG95877.1 2-keto-4-pentenoate hydratase [Ligilactobacillus salitolerans]
MTTENKTAALTATEKEFATTLYQAYATHTPLNMADYEQTVTDDDSAYRVQAFLTNLKEEPVGGYKVSLTSKETQDMFDADSPLYGAQVESHFRTSPANFKPEDLMDPLAEVELMFTAKEDLSSSDTPEDLLAKTKVAAAVEVPDSRFSDWFPSLPKHLVMADAAVGGYVVYGPERDSTDVFSSPEDVASVTCKLYHDGEHLKDGAATEVLGNPLSSLHWLTEKLAEQGTALKAGQRVSSGTFLLPEHVTAGTWRADFNWDLGSVEVNVAE